MDGGDLLKIRCGADDSAAGKRSERKAPVIITMGSEDAPAQAKRLKERLEKAGHAVEYHEDAGVGHQVTADSMDAVWHRLVVGPPPAVFRGTDAAKRTFFVEIFVWRSPAATAKAHTTPAVMEIWEGMGALTEARLGRPAMEFPHVRPVRLARAQV